MAYKLITIAEMTDFLKVGNGWKRVDPCGEETYFDFQVGKFILRVYSSIYKGVSRKKATDAIRICLLTKRLAGSEGESNPTLVGVKSFRIVRREENWQKHLRLRVMEAHDYAKTVPECPRCKAPLTVRTARVTKKKFYGCTRYPFCIYTVAILDKYTN